MELKLHEFDLELKYPFGISRERRRVQKTLIVELIQDGFHGYGETVVNHKYYQFTSAESQSLLNSISNDLSEVDMTNTSPSELWTMFNAKLKHNPFAQCALDMAAYDLWGKVNKTPTYTLFGLNPNDAPVTSYTIGLDDISVMVKKLKEYRSWPVFKIKLGTDQDLEILHKLREYSDAIFRVDANCAWTVNETLNNAERFKNLNIEFIEEPLTAKSWAGMKKLYRKSPLQLMADESCISESDVSACSGHFHAVNIKVVKCGGLTPALRMINEAKKLGLKTMLGCMTESTVGVSGIAQLLPLVDYADIDGPLLLAKDIATGIRFDKGKIIYNSLNGNGVQLL